MWNVVWRIEHMSVIERHSHCTISDLHLRTRKGRSIIWDHCHQNSLKHSWRRPGATKTLELSINCDAEPGVVCRIFSPQDWSDLFQCSWDGLLQVLCLFSWILSQIFPIRNRHKSKWHVMMGRGGGKRACACESLNESWEEWVPLHTSELTRRCLRLAHVCRKSS